MNHKRLITPFKGSITPTVQANSPVDSKQFWPAPKLFLFCSIVLQKSFNIKAEVNWTARIRWPRNNAFHAENDLLLKVNLNNVRLFNLNFLCFFLWLKYSLFFCLIFISQWSGEKGWRWQKAEWMTHFKVDTKNSITSIVFGLL